MERSADILKHKGYRVSASEVEAVLQDHPVVVGACVVGVPDPKVGERVKAIVVIKEDAKGVGRHGAYQILLGTPCLLQGACIYRV